MNQLVESSALAEVACHVLETTAFAFSQVCAAGESSLPDVGVLRAEIRFAGDADGFIRLEAAYEAATNIAGNLLGVDCDDISETQAIEAMCELLNIIAGQWLTRAFGVTAERMKKARPNAIVMHPGPMNRDVEIASEVADGPQSVIQRQVANGVAVRMAVLATIVRNVQARRHFQ